MHIAWVYILTNDYRTVLFVGATVDLYTRLWEHRTKQNPKSFSAQYNVAKLVYYEDFEEVDAAFERERYIKKKKRKWKEALITKFNPEWKDLTEEIDRW